MKKCLFICLTTLLSSSLFAANIQWNNVGFGNSSNNGVGFGTVTSSNGNTTGYTSLGNYHVMDSRGNSATKISNDVWRTQNGSTITNMGNGTTIIRGADGSLKGTCSEIYGIMRCY